MEDFSHVLAHERFAMQRAAEQEITGLLGQFFFAFSDFVTALHLCVAWHDWGEGLDQYGGIAGDLGTADLLRRIERQVSKVYASDKSAQWQYLEWLRRPTSSGKDEICLPTPGGIQKPMAATRSPPPPLSLSIRR